MDFKEAVKSIDENNKSRFYEIYVDSGHVSGIGPHFKESPKINSAEEEAINRFIVELESTTVLNKCNFKITQIGLYPHDKKISVEVSLDVIMRSSQGCEKFAEEIGVFMNKYGITAHLVYGYMPVAIVGDIA